MRRLAIVAALAFTILLLPSPAEAGLRWEGERPVVLVYAPVPTEWGVGKAVTQWNKNGAITLRMSPVPCSNCITVAEMSTPGNRGEAYVHYSGTYSVPESILHCEIRLDPLYRDARAHGTAAHEVGHCLGLPHNRNFYSVMNTDNWMVVDRPSRADLRRINNIYQEAS